VELDAAGDGEDRIVDTGGSDELRFGAGVSPDQVSRVRNGDDLVLQVGGTGDTLEINGWFTDPASQVEQVSFADGTVWDTATTETLRVLGDDGDNFLQGYPFSPQLMEGFGGNDFLFAGSGNDTLDGGTGNDWMQGGEGDDVYIYDRHSGVDWIYDQADASGGNRVEFTGGITPDELQLSYDYINPGSLVIRFATSTQDELHLAGFDNTNVLGPRAVETFAFEDGTVLSYEDLVSRGFDVHATGVISQDFVQGTSVNDRMFGSNQGDTLDALEGNDTLYGGGGGDTLHGDDGDDYLDGGPGNDNLLGWKGSDTYFFDRNSGNDRILELQENP